MKLGRLPESRAEIERAIALTQNLRERQLLAEKLKKL
jgi:predicted RNA polymerase sigma factor